MHKIWYLKLIAVFLGFFCLFKIVHQSIDLPVKSTENNKLIDQTHQLAHSIVYTLIVPKLSNFSLVPVQEDTQLKTVEDFAKQYRAIAVLNGGFFDPQNQQTTSYVISKGKLVADPRQNDRLVNNPDLAPYIEKILDRSELRRYLCGTSVRYDITFHSQPTPKDCQLIDALGGGPSLLPNNTSEREGFITYENNTKIRDALGSNFPNARSAVGITKSGDLVLVMVAQKSESPNKSGMSFSELTVFLKNLNVEKAMNLDGGSSTSFYYQGKTFYGKVDSEGNLIKRPVKSVLILR